MADHFRLRAIDDEIEIELDQDVLVVGRDSGCDAVIKHEDISRCHARFKVSGDTVTVQDLESTNGTSVNNRKIFKETVIRSGDVLKFGAKAFYLLAPQDDASDVTILESNLAGVLNDTQESFIEDGFPQGDETVFHQKFPLPAGWSTYRADDGFSALDKDDRADENVDRLLSKQLLVDGAISAALVVTSGKHESQVMPLMTAGDKQTWVIGRDSDAQLRLNEVSISLQHAEIVYDGGSWRIEDRGSTNGVKVNGKKEQRSVLRDRDKISLGGVTMMFCLRRRP
jgi:pSer/pThr/pTyr-binding forkhead associated (FHA) protein